MDYHKIVILGPRLAAAAAGDVPAGRVRLLRARVALRAGGDPGEG